MANVPWRRLKKRVGPSLKRLKPVIVVLFLLVVLGGCGVLIRGCLYRESGIVRIGYMKNTRSLPLFVAMEQDLFGKAGLKIKCEPFEYPSQGLTDLADDRIDLCITVPILSLMMSEDEKQKNLRLLYLAMISAAGGNDAFIVRKDSAMKGPGELRGRRIAVAPGKTNVTFARLALRAYLGEKPDVRFVEIPVHEQLNALKNRNVMAVLAFEPTISQGEEQGVSRVLLRGPLETALMDPMPIAGAALSMSYVESNPKTTRKLVGILLKAAEFCRKNEEEARQIASKHLKLKDTVAADLPIDRFWNVADLDEAKRDSLQSFADLLRREEILEQAFPMERLFLEKSMIPRYGSGGGGGGGAGRSRAGSEGDE